MRPTRYESVGCDDENFSSPKEYEAKGEVYLRKSAASA